MLGKTVCILLSGKAGVGKTTSANLIKDMTIGNDTLIASFAEGVKWVARQHFGWDGYKDQAGRQLLQDIGQTGRKYNPDIWVARTFEEFIPRQTHYPFDFVVVDDWRFPNEVDYVRNHQPLYSVYTIRIEAPQREMLWGTPQYNDISEVALDEYDFDYVIDNSTNDLGHLLTGLTRVMSELILKEDTFK